MSYLITGVMYFLATILSSMVVVTLIMELKAKKSRFIFFLLLHFIVCVLMMMTITICLVAKHHGVEGISPLGMDTLVWGALGGLSLLLYDMWENYFKIKRKK